jgi:hypothetical protein
VRGTPQDAICGLSASRRSVPHPQGGHARHGRIGRTGLPGGSDPAHFPLVRRPRHGKRARLRYTTRARSATVGPGYRATCTTSVLRKRLGEQNKFSRPVEHAKNTRKYGISARRTTGKN